MRNIVRLFLLDLRHLMDNAIAALVVVGLVLVPPLYAWFTTAGFWDPYANTGNLKVAVANADEGYRSDLIPVKVNAGESVVSALRANDQFDWVFVSEDEAVEGIRAGRYYASIVIPASFSRDLLTVFSDDAEHADIIYYTNQKENAIAPRVTGAGASALEQQVDEAFSKTVGDVALGTTSSLLDFVDGDGIVSYGKAVNERLGQAEDELRGAAAQARAFGELVGSASSLADATASTLGGTQSAAGAARPLLDEAQAGIDDATDALDAANATADQAFSQAESSLDAVGAAVDEALDALQGTPGAAQGVLSSASSDVQGVIDGYRALRDDVAAADPTSALLPRIDQAILQLANLRGSIDDASEALGQGAARAEAARADVTARLDEARASLAGLHDAYDDQLADESQRLRASLAAARDTASDLAGSLDEALGGLDGAAGALGRDLEQVRTSLGDAADVLDQAADDLSTARGQLAAALASGDIDEAKAIIGSDPGRVAQFLSAPTELVTHAVWPMADNGSAMSPFYTSLSLWIGAIFMVALMQVVVSPRRRAQLDHPTPGQLYLGRYGVFLALGLAQATIVVTGNVFFLGVQCDHLLLYYLAAWAAALVFTNIVYTLTVSFGNIGKAIAIILLVLQLAGSGGIFPVQMSADFFQAVYPWLPFAHSMEAFQGAMAGIYGDQYWVSLGLLLALLVPSLLLGLVLRRPVIRLNDYVLRKLDETRVL
ncbi:MAG: YhgE/Pip domain-containing protein [Eggerthellaceae bacterium]|nr:YhgE/Pip domain-containing protein [Eggerthellaceae bacterium]